MKTTMDTYHHDMSIAMSARVPTAAEVAALDAFQIASLLRSQANTIEALQRQLEWFKRQVFGAKSERFAPQPDALQMHLGEDMAVPPQPQPAESTVPAHTRRKRRSDFADDRTNAPFFDESKVPVQTIKVPNPEVRDLKPGQYDMIGEKCVFRRS